MNFYRAVLYPLTKPTAMLLDWWLGGRRHHLSARARHSFADRSQRRQRRRYRQLEAIGARNFLDLDDVPVTEEGELVDAESIISMPQANNRCVLPDFDRSPDDPFLRKIDASGKKWVIVTDLNGEPVFVLDSHQFLRDALFDQLETNPNNYWHRPIVVRDMKTKLGDVIGHMKVVPERPDDDVIDNDLILVWGEQKRIITGADLLGRLLCDCGGGWRRRYTGACGTWRAVRRRGRGLRGRHPCGLPVSASPRSNF